MSAPTTSDAGWQLQDSAADAYEAHLVPVIFEAISRHLVEAADVDAGAHVLDVACGTACAARAAAHRVGPTGAVVGVDLNPDMLATARRATAGSQPAIELHQADAADLPFDDDRFDAVLCQEALQFMPDPVAVLREMARVGRPRGRVACSVLCGLELHPVYATLAAALGRHAGPEAETMMASPFRFGDAQKLRLTAQQAGLADVTVHIATGEERFPSVAEFVRQEAASSPLAGPLGHLDGAQHDALVDELEQALASYLDDAGLVFANATHILCGTIP